MKVCKSWNEVIDNIASIIEREIKKIGNETKKAVKSELKARFYGRPGYYPDDDETKAYFRTFELLECITYEYKRINKNEFQVEIFYDTDRMSTRDVYPGYWSTHQNITDGTDFRQYLPEIIEFGNPSRLYGWEPFNIVGEVRDRWIADQVILQHFRDAFRKEGFQVVEG